MIIGHKALRYKDKVVFEKMIFRNFFRMPKSFTEKEACFMYLQEGSFLFRTPEKLLKVNKGDAFLSKCSDYFFEQDLDIRENTELTKGVGIYLYPLIVRELFDFDLSISDFETDYDTTKVDINRVLENYINGIDYLLENQAISTDSMIKIKLKEFLLLLSNTENAPTLLDFVSSLFKPYEYDFKTIIEQNVFADLSVAELSKLCGMSTSTFQRTFQKVFNQTPSKYIIAQRMIKAKKMLKNKNARISDIAYECGYKSTSTFNRIFKKSFNSSPSQFRVNESGY